MTDQGRELTQLLIDWGDGDKEAFERLTPLVYDELRRMAHAHMNRERAGHTLQTTALVNEAYVRLIDQRRARFANRAHFFAIAAQIMRRILVDHARAHGRAKRGGGVPGVALDLALEEAPLLAPERSEELLYLDDALHKLKAVAPRRAAVVEMRHFGGLSVEEVAVVLKVSPNTVIRDWNLSKAWLRREVETGGASGGV
ncbi:MAG: sigma-70 family RNA polymerase sigma factor [Acidobacteria bacterium]|nr:sigma-70 family RNA polymerase sigma factor [Acidobacteriota bacterium]